MVLVRVGTVESATYPHCFPQDMLDSPSSPHDKFVGESTECPESLGYFGSFQKPDLRDRDRRPGGLAAVEWALTDNMPCNKLTLWHI